jgi:DNA-binding transcriptional regulator YbjK
VATIETRTKPIRSLSPRGAARRDAILDAAIRIIAREGVQAATHRAVAHEAGVALAATTYYFASREQLVVEALRQVATRGIADLERAARELPARMSVALTAALFATTVADELRSRRAQLVAEHSLHLEAARLDAVRDAHRAWVDAAHAFFAAGMRACGSPQPDTDGALVLAVVTGLQLGDLADPDPLIEGKLLGPLMRRLLHALVPG